MNTSHIDFKSRPFHFYEPRLEDHLEHEHDLISNGLRRLLALVCSEPSTQNKDEEIEFRNHLIWISRIMKAHMTSEERVVFKSAYPSLNAYEKKEIDHLCDVNCSVDMILDSLENQSWNQLETIRAKVMLLIQLFDTHVQYEDEGLANRLKTMPVRFHRTLIRKLVHSENEFLDWMSEIERPFLPV